VIGLSINEPESSAAAMLAAGAAGYVNRACAAEQLCAAIRAAVAKDPHNN